MAYNPLNLFLVHEGGGGRAKKWVYEGADAASTVCEAGFISNAYARGMRVGDEVLIKQFASTALLALTQPVRTVVASVSENTGALLKRMWGEVGDTITASLTLSRALVGKVLPVNSASDVVLTVPPDVDSGGFGAGEMFCTYREGAGQLSFAAGVGVTLDTPSGLLAAAQHATIGLWRKPTADTWLVVGNLTA